MHRSEILTLAAELGWHAVERPGGILLYRPSLPSRQEALVAEGYFRHWSDGNGVDVPFTEGDTIRTVLQARAVPSGVERAKAYIERYGSIDGGHHKQWVLDQVMRALTDCPALTGESTDSKGKTYFYMQQGESPEYKQWCESMRGEWDPKWEEYEYSEWDTGRAP